MRRRRRQRWPAMCSLQPAIASLGGRCPWSGSAPTPPAHGESTLSVLTSPPVRPDLPLNMRDPCQLKMVAVWRATTAKGVAQVPQEGTQPLGLLGGGRSDGRASRDVLSGLVQRDVQVFGGRAVEPQNDVIPHAQTLIARRGAPVGQGRQCADLPGIARRWESWPAEAWT